MKNKIIFASILLSIAALSPLKATLDSGRFITDFELKKDEIREDPAKILELESVTKLDIDKAPSIGYLFARMFNSKSKGQIREELAFTLINLYKVMTSKEMPTVEKMLDLYRVDTFVGFLIKEIDRKWSGKVTLRWSANNVEKLAKYYLYTLEKTASGQEKKEYGTKKASENVKFFKALSEWNKQVARRRAAGL